MSVNSHKAKNLKPEQERMRAAVARLQKYMATYDQQPMYLDYQDKTFIDDVLYGLGTALSLDYQYAGGFEKFKDFLRKRLEQPHGPFSRDAVLEEAAKLAETYYDTGRDMGQSETAKAISAAIRALKNAAPQVVGKSADEVWPARASSEAGADDGWIPVSKRLPTKYPFIIRWNDETTEHVCDRYEVINVERMGDPTDIPESVDWEMATHWRDLPLPAATERSEP